MHQCYDDILRRIPEPPRRFDDADVPRYDAFAPDDLANITLTRRRSPRYPARAAGRSSPLR